MSTTITQINLFIDVGNITWQNLEKKLRTPYTGIVTAVILKTTEESSEGKGGYEKNTKKCCNQCKLLLTRNALHWVLPWELVTQAHIYFPKIVQQYKNRNEHGKLSQCLFLSSIQKSREHIRYTSNQRTEQLSYTILGGHYTTIKHTIYVSFVDT